MRKIIFITILFTLCLFANEPLKKVSLQFMWHDQYEFAGFYVAKEKGFYKDLGLEVEFKKFTVDTKITDVVVNEEVSFGTSSSSLLIDKAKGKELVLLGSVFQSSPLILLALENSNIKTIKDIKNKKIMLTKDQQYFATLQAMLASKDISIEDIDIVKHSFNVDDLINKNTDLMLAYTTNEPYVLKERGHKGKIFHPKDYGFDFYEELIFTSKNFAKNNPQIVENFYNASIKGWEYAFNNIDEVSKLVFEKYNPQNKSLKSLVYEANEMKKLAYTKDGNFGEITVERLKLIEHTYRILGFLNEELDIDELLFFKQKRKYSNSLNLNKKEQEYLDSIAFIPMCVDPDWMPYEKLDNGRHIGISADNYKLIEKNINKEIKIIPTNSWAETLKFAKEGKCDVVSLALETKSRKEYLDFTKPLFDTSLVIVTDLKTSFILKENKLKNKKIGITQGYAYIEVLKEKYPEVEFIEYESTNEGLNAILSGEIFGFADILITVAHEIQREFPTQLKISGKFDIKTNLKIATRKDLPILNSILNKAIDTISANEKQDILNKWISVKYEKSVDKSFFYKTLAIILIITLVFLFLYRQILLKKTNKELKRKVKLEIEKNNQKHQLITQQTKKVAMAEILENIAHQWRQPLSVISVAATGMKIKKEHGILDEKELLESIDFINEHTQLLSRTIDDFTSFYKDEQVFTNFHIRDTINKSLDFFKVQFNQKNIFVIKNIVNVELNTIENKLIQIIINILNNAKDALITNCEENRYIFITTYKKEKSFVIEIKDNAGGISKKILHKIFEPYFTTKHKSQGTGIGLYMSEQIASKNLKASIEARNEKFTYEDKKYKGAVFTISLPLALPYKQS